MSERVFIVGNGGSGKTWLGERLAARLGHPLYRLDDLHWLPNFAGERPRAERDQLVTQAAGTDRWIMEGIYGSILQLVLPRVTTLVWLDIPDDECVANQRQRGQTGGGSEEQFRALLAYTGAYRQRTNLNSFGGHQRFYAEFPRHKRCLKGRSELDALLAEASR